MISQGGNSLGGAARPAERFGGLDGLRAIAASNFLSSAAMTRASLTGSALPSGPTQSTKCRTGSNRVSVRGSTSERRAQPCTGCLGQRDPVPAHVGIGEYRDHRGCLREQRRGAAALRGELEAVGAGHVDVFGARRGRFGLGRAGAAMVPTLPIFEPGE